MGKNSQSLIITYKAFLNLCHVILTTKPTGKRIYPQTVVEVDTLKYWPALNVTSFDQSDMGTS